MFKENAFFYEKLQISRGGGRSYVLEMLEVLYSRKIFPRKVFFENHYPQSSFQLLKLLTATLAD